MRNDEAMSCKSHYNSLNLSSLYPAVCFKLFFENAFLQEHKRASFGRFLSSVKNTFSPKKAFHFHPGHQKSNQFSGHMKTRIIKYLK